MTKDTQSPYVLYKHASQEMFSLIEDILLENDHADFCPQSSIPEAGYPCECMHRRHYNLDNLREEAKLVVSKYGGLFAQ